jgi:hypothetical protein
MLHDLLNYVAFVKTVVFIKHCYYCFYVKFNKGLSSDSNAAVKKLFLEVKNRQKCEKKCSWTFLFAAKALRARREKEKEERLKIKD